MIKRKSFAKIAEAFDLPNLVEVQTKSYADFLQADVPKTKRKKKGLESVLQETFPVESVDGAIKLEYINYTLGKPKYTIEECQKRGLTFAAPLRVKLRLRTQKDIREQEVYLGDIPLMTSSGTFIINGDERAVVSQLHRSPGICFEENMHPNGKRLYSARIIPYRGAWLEFEFDVSDCIYVNIDRRKKFSATTFLRAIGFSTNEEILALFYDKPKKVKVEGKSSLKDCLGQFIAKEIVDDEGKILVPFRERIDRETVDVIVSNKIDSIEVVSTEKPEILNTLVKDRTTSTEEALIDIYRRLRPGDPPTLEAAKNLIHRLFFDPRRYDLGKVGRYILNRKLNMKKSLEDRLIDRETIITALKYLIDLKNGEGQVDDIDHLGNRRVRTVDELLQSQFRIGLARIERSARERMNIYDIETMMPHNLINSKLVSAVIRDFFGRSQLSQFMDQTNPLAELTHKRRLSALGPGGLSRERAGFEVRDVHYSHYGRICPIETPEGPNIGLIASLSAYARVNEFGFIETPYRKVVNGKVTNKIEYLSADVEDNYIIVQANARLDRNGRLVERKVFCRYKHDFIEASPKQVQYMDVSPKQLVSVAANLIPFLEHDDANRALMGSNMQRQAVPLLETEAPLVGTGMEHRCVKDIGAVVVAENSGIVKHVQSDQIIIGSQTYNLRKFARSNTSTCINQRPIVKLGQKIKEGEIIADGAGTKDGELALGRNVLVAFMPWRGYNFEDAILVSEKLVKEDIYTSVHIEEFEIEARDTRLGNEEITRDIPNVGEEALKDLDESGIIRIGAEVGPGDILVGKVTPKSETELSPEEKLLRAIFGEKAGDVKDASLTVPPGIEGIVVDVKVFTRKSHRHKTKEQLREESEEINEVKSYFESQVRALEKERTEKLKNTLLGQRATSNIVDKKSKRTIVTQNRKITKNDLNQILAKANLQSVRLENQSKEEEIKRIDRSIGDQIEEINYELAREIDKIKRGDELPAGVLKKVVVYVASKRKLSVGDKMAGRHGNKGVIAKILPEEDMPFMPDGTPVEVVLNPLGVPSRMNVGQILETHLGWAAKALGYYVSTPVFNGATEAEIKEELKKANLPQDGRVKLRDGRTGKYFDQSVCVGYLYMMKLAHLVDDKIHARSIGPYSLVTQQPLGGKAQFGGQRFGEMEVWALEGYGAAYTLQELLTVKSDDVTGRTRIYETIVKGENALNPGTPESFNVLIKELQSLALNVKVIKKK
jgi:DNA-directed RNA polymerase subunit beta